MSSISGDISNKANDLKNTFTNWDTCMSKTYCKWPVIAAIIIASIIVLSLVWCIASCLCCGATLCGSCVQCLTCCGCCGACGKGRGGGGGGGRSRHKDDYTQMPPTPYNGYQPQPTPMMYQPPTSGAQFAQFDAPTKRIHEDSLPAMPSWDTARTRQVADHSESANGFGNDVEMGTIHSGQRQPRTRGGYNQVPHGPMSPVSPPANYGHFEGQEQPYGSDLGAQRLGQHHQQQQTGYADSYFTPLSPAPTYRTNPATIATANPDRFTRGTMSPTPSEYNRNHYAAPSREQTWSPIAISHQEPVDHQNYRQSIPSPVEHNPPTYAYEQHDSSGARPPSLLQIGRKPVNGSQREI